MAGYPGWSHWCQSSEGCEGISNAKPSNISAHNKKGPLGGAGLGKGGNIQRVYYRFFFFAFLAAITFPLLCWILGVCEHNHYLWSRTTLPLYVVWFKLFVKKYFAECGFYSQFVWLSSASLQKFVPSIFRMGLGKCAPFLVRRQGRGGGVAVGSRGFLLRGSGPAWQAFRFGRCL